MDRSEQPTPITLSSFQSLIHERYYEHDAKRGAPATFMWFIEEVGELATALHGEDEENLHEEFADVLAWLCTLANIRGIDLEKAIIQKYYQSDGPIEHK